MTAHDGFTLNDLVSYNDKHNEPNGEENRDGHDNNQSWNHGAEGTTDDQDIVALRERQKRNFLSTLLLSQGTPMILAGDEFGRTQNGNNNAYCQDNDVSWVDWQFDEQAESLIEFTKRLTALRRRYPVLRQSRFLSGIWNEELGLKDATWLTPAGQEMTADDWHNPAAKCLGILLDGRAQASGIRQRGSEATLLLITNAYHDVVPFILPKVAGGRDWRRLVDTNRPEEDDDPDRSVLCRFGQQYQVTGRSLLLFALRQVRARRYPVSDHAAAKNAT